MADKTVGNKRGQDIARNAEKTSEKTRTAPLKSNPSPSQVTKATKKISKS